MATHAAEHPALPTIGLRREPLGSRRKLVGRGLSILATCAMLAGGWWLFAPPAIGGNTSFAIVDGTSMLPHFHRGDLVVIRPAKAYRVGDVVAYRSRLLRRVVLHRIVAIENGHYTFKGDNNSWTDPERPTRSELIGKRWLHIPGAGTITGQLRNPKIAAALAALLVLSLGLGGRRTHNKPR